mgnify:CR=1 FL=1
MWLKSLAKKQLILPKEWAKKAGISETTAKSWLLAGSVPRPNHWPKIAKHLGMSFNEVSFNFMNQLEEENRIKECIVCDKMIILWQPHIKLCNSKSCRMQYDRDRKRHARMMNRPSNYKPNKRRFLGNVSNLDVDSMSSKVNRETINHAMAEYLANGGKITRLDDGIADGSDQFSLEMMDAGIDLIEMD